jgi:hypothetical protein
VLVGVYVDVDMDWMIDRGLVLMSADDDDDDDDDGCRKMNVVGEDEGGEKEDEGEREREGQRGV